MAAVDFPADLPRPQVEGHGLNPVSPFVRMQMVSGRARQRRSFTSVPVMTSLSWVLSSVEAQLFEAWFRDDVNDGADWFNCSLRTPMAEGATDGVEDYEVRFTYVYSVSQIGPRYWKVTAPVEMRERQILAPGWTVTPGLVLGSSIIDLALNREWPES